MVRYSREDALTEKEFVLLTEAADELKEPYDIQTKFILYAAGRMGMRSGEIAHISSEWVDFSQNVVRIPEHDECNKGKFGEICGYCRNRARDYISNRNKTEEEYIQEINSETGGKLDRETLREIAVERMEENNLTVEEASSE